VSERLHLDHTGHIVADLAAAARLYGRLGFDLQPVSHHQTPGPDGKMVSGGTSNQCAMLEQGYLELLTVTDRNAPSYSARENAAFLDRFEGLHLLAMGTRDAAATRARLAQAGVAFEARDLGRMVDGPSGRGEARFRLMPVGDLTDANSVFFFIEHATRELVWSPGSTRHRNGAKRLRELVLVADVPAPVAARIDRAFGMAGQAAGAMLEWRLERSRLLLATPAAAQEHLGTTLSRRDGVHAAGQVIEVADLAAAEQLLAENKVRFTHHAGRLTVAQADCLGVALQFCEVRP
jgi:hypothetical protein